MTCEPYCRHHCYESSAEDRILYLERQLAEANQRAHEAHSRAYYLDSELRDYRRGDKNAHSNRFAYLEGKIYRQRRAIQAIQRKGWQPSLIIKEEVDA